MSKLIVTLGSTTAELILAREFLSFIIGARETKCHIMEESSDKFKKVLKENLAQSEAILTIPMEAGYGGGGSGTLDSGKIEGGGTLGGGYVLGPATAIEPNGLFEIVPTVNPVHEQPKKQRKPRQPKIPLPPMPALEKQITAKEVTEKAMNLFRLDKLSLSRMCELAVKAGAANLAALDGNPEAIEKFNKLLDHE